MLKWPLYLIIAVTAYTCNQRPQTASTAANQPASGRDTIALLLNKLDAKEKATQIDSFFNVLVKKNHFNGNVLVAQQGQVIYKHSFGYENYRTRTPLTLNSSFQLGSVSKQFTAMAIMMLKERGQLSYSDSIQRFFPQFPYKGITVRMLLTQRSGLPNYMYFCDSLCNNRQTDTPISNMEVINVMIKDKPQEYYRPGRKFEYCNTNYCVLAAIVEKVTGETFDAFLKQNIFDPLKMNNTEVYNAFNPPVIPNETTGYEKNRRTSGHDYLDGVEGDKDIYSTVGDLLKWDDALYTNKLVQQSTLQEAFKPGSKRWRHHKNYGFGWWIMRYNGDKIVYHEGWWHGYNCLLMRRMRDHSVIIILSNRVNWCINKSKELLSVLDKSKDNPLKNQD